MKYLKYLVITVILLNSPTILVAQEDPDLPPPPPPPYFELSSEDEQEYLKNIDSDLKLKLQQIKEFNKQKYVEYLQELRWRGMELSYMHMGKEKEMIKREQQIVEYNILTESLAIEYQKASSAEKEKIKKELEKNLNNLFDLKEMQRESEVKVLEVEIKKLKQKIASRKNNKSTIIRRRTEELLGEEKYLDWE